MATWTLDPTHSSAGFAARHMMISTVRGSFRNVSGTLHYDPEHIEDSSVEAVIDVSMMDSTGVADRDAHLQSADFLDTEHYPTITFKSTRVEPTGEDSARIIGDLTIRNVTREVVVNATRLGQVISPYGKTVAGFEGTTRINREDFGLTWNMVVEGGGFMVGREIDVRLEIEAQLVEEEVPA